MIYFRKDWIDENGLVRAVPHLETQNKSFLRITQAYRRMGIKNHLFPLTLIQPDLAKYDPHNLKDPSIELRARIGLECRYNPWYYFREVIRIPMSGGTPIPFEAHRGNMAMIWCYYNDISYIGIQPRQTGKDQPLDAMIKTPSGWTRMGDIKIDDLVTMPDGTISKVTGVYPQGVKNVYRVTFEDGRTTRCGREHLWKVYDPDTNEEIVIPLKDICEGMSIPLIRPEDQEDSVLPIDPYTVGIAVSQDDGSIPSEYKNVSPKQRFYLLQGLMDTRGVVCDLDTVTYTTLNRTLALDIQYMIRSLGGICRMEIRDPGLLTYTLYIQINGPIRLFRYHEKRSLLSDMYSPVGTLKLGIKSIDHIGQEETQCISVAHPDQLYVTDNFVVTHNTICAIGIDSQVIFFGGYRVSIGMLTKDTKLRFENVARLKDIRNALPQYLIDLRRNDQDNKEGLEYSRLDNKYLTYVGRADEAGADNLGRGMTIPTIHFEELAFTKNIQITYPIIMGSTTRARADAKANRQPYANLITTTAASLTSEEGRFAYNYVNRAMPFTEKLFDRTDKEDAHKFVALNSANGTVNGTFNYLQLGKDHEWFVKTTAILEASEDVIAREFLNDWSRGNSKNIITPDILLRMRNAVREPNYVQTIGDYIINWYVPRVALESPGFTSRKFVLGMDSSDVVGEDFTTLCMMDPKDMSIVATFRCNETNITKLAMFVGDLLVKFHNTTFIPERKSSAAGIIDTVILILLNHGMSPFCRIYNTIVQNRTDKQYEGINLADPQLVDKGMRKHLGFITTSTSRTRLYKEILLKAVGLNADKMCDSTLVMEFSGLALREGRVDHEVGGHDDSVISYLLCCYLLFDGKNLHLYGLHEHERMVSVTKTGQSVSLSYHIQQLELRKKIQHYRRLYDAASHSPLIQTTFKAKIKLLEQQLDHEVVVEPLSKDSLLSDLRNYGSEAYTAGSSKLPSTPQRQLSSTDLQMLTTIL